MNLKKIEIYGFKSFADKVVIDFRSNTTAIVGPNGCGKSNIVDAVRWVLGEQRPTVLRCQKMHDLIFGGTESRKSISYCEVSLYLENTPRYYRCDHDEVILTRKLTRGNESEYFINKKQVRLRDILELFRDSGIGRDGYSIIGQSRIEEIISVKPEARRQIFEEAAGINNHKVRKNEAERKLENARMNIDRLNDIIVTAYKNLPALENQAKKATEAASLKSELKFLELSNFFYKCENSAAERDRLEALLKKSGNELGRKTDELSELNYEYDRLNDEITKSDYNLGCLNNKLLEMSVEFEKKKGTVSRLEERINGLNDALKNAKDEINLTEKKKEDREKDKLAYMSSGNEKKLLLSEKTEKCADIQRQYITTNEDLTKQETTYEQSVAMLEENRGKLADIDKTKFALETEREGIINNMMAGNAEFKEKKAKYEELNAKKEQLLKEKEAIAEKREQKTRDGIKIRNNYNEIARDLKLADEKLKKLEDLKKELILRIRQLEEYINDYAGYNEVIKRLMNEAQRTPAVAKKILGTVGEVITVPRELQVAIEVALGGAIQNIITETPEDAAALVDILKRNNYGRATFLPITTVRANDLSYEYTNPLKNEEGVFDVASALVDCDTKFKGVISNLLGRTVVVDDKTTAIRVSKKYRQGFRIVTLDGELFAQSGAITGGSIPGANTRILSKENELGDNKKKLEATERDLKNVAKMVESLTAESEKYLAAIKAAEIEMHRLEVETETLNVKIAGTDSESELYNLEIDKIISSESNLKERVDRLDREIKLAGERMNVQADAKVSAADYITELKNKILEDREKRDNMFNRWKSAEAEITSLQNDIKTAESEAIKAGSDVTLYARNLNELRSREATLRAEIESVKTNIDATNFTDEEKAAIEEVKRMIANMNEAKLEIQGKVREITTTKDAVNIEISKINEKHIREQAALENIDKDIEVLASRVREDYSLDFSGARDYLIENAAEHEKYEFNPSAAPAKITKIRRSVENLGPINELAAVEYAEQKAAHDEYSRQYEDLISTEKNLTKLINELTQEMEIRFKDCIEKVNINFQDTFKQLFDGGRAKLEIEKKEGVSVLDAGIDISAQPPGKKLQSLSLLSGGEKTLTAFAILFAIIKLKPMPFCILDEAEAALDESNVRLISKYVSRVSGVTQFIMVTHKKETMVASGLLYGITMEEKGVSKSVNISLQDALEYVKDK